MSSSGQIVNLVNPTNAQDAATKIYVDNATTNMATTTHVSSAITTALGSGSQTNNPTIYDTGNQNASFRLVMSQQTSGRATLYNDEGLTYNAANNTLTAGTFSGNLSGNASTATTATTATTAEYATRTPSNKFTINGGSGYYNDIPEDTMLYIKDQGWGHGPMIRLRSILVNNKNYNFTIGQVSGTADCYLWNDNDGYMRFGTNNIEGMRISSGGNIGIGTPAPAYKLHVVGTGVSARTKAGYIGFDGGYGNAMDTNRNVIAGFNGGWVAGETGFICFSDKRIKTDINPIEISNNLRIFRKLSPITYTHIDKLKNGNNRDYGFIAQEVQQLLPEAVVTDTQIIPSIYKTATVVNNVLHFDNPLKDIQQFNSGTKLKCYDDKNQIVWVVIKAIIDSQNIEIEETNTNDKLFVYGHSVDDFLHLDKDAIFTVATAALQEVDRQQQADKARIAELEAKVSEQQSLINDILERLKKVERA